ncbi:MAG: hypothetical protein PHH60_00885 [Candidatus Margulisbacteria bacterium]|nr:hypothetical protein [Candidatus Margulisiibacteriota bacterium]
MKKSFLLLLLLLLLAGTVTWADYYNAQHWLIGSLEAGAAASANGHNVYVYYPPTSESYATDVSGPTGNSRLNERYMINAFDIPAVTYAPGFTVSAEVRGEYRAGPVGLTGSAAGYDVVPLMTLVKMASLEILAIAESGVNLRNGDFFPYDPELSIKLVNPNIRSLIVRSEIDLRRADDQTLVATTGATGLQNVYRFPGRLPNGIYDLTAYIWDAYNNSGQKKIEDLNVTDDKIAKQVVTDKIVWRAKSGELLTVAYELSQDMPVTLYGYNVSGELVKMVFAAAGTDGGRAGYNQIRLNGKIIQGGMLGNGIYIFQITSGNKLLYKFKVVVNE